MAAARLRTLLVLGRVSNLPTVWSNCLAAWLLAGGGEGKRLALLLASGSCLYLGGMFLNDACDAEFDRRQRQERPIPSGLISRGAVWACGVAGLVAGVLLAAPLGIWPLGCALVLVATIVAYDVWHKRNAFALGLVAVCRFLLYALAGLATAGTVSHRVLAAAAGVAVYVLGISLLARHESGTSRPPRWPLLLLAVPMVPALCYTSTGAWGPTVLAIVLFTAWLAPALRSMWTPAPQTGWVVSRLLAGLVLADWLQVAALAQSWPCAAAYAALFGLTLLLQRRVPAT